MNSEYQFNNYWSQHLMYTLQEIGTLCKYSVFTFSFSQNKQCYSRQRRPYGGGGRLSHRPPPVRSRLTSLLQSLIQKYYQSFILNLFIINLFLSVILFDLLVFFLDSEHSKESIDFNMICVFFYLKQTTITFSIMLRT